MVQMHDWAHILHTRKGSQDPARVEDMGEGRAEAVSHWPLAETERKTLSWPAEQVVMAEGCDEITPWVYREHASCRQEWGRWTTLGYMVAML